MSWLSDEALCRLRSAASAPDLSGTRYVLLGEVGRGGMCTVFLAEDPSLKRRVALKVLDLPDPSGELAERLSREARILARLEHPGIAPVHEVGRLADGRLFYSMKYVEGPRLDAFARSSAMLPERLRLFQRIAETVAFAHDRGVLHRDLKPENIMVGPFGEVLVMDWGLARILEEGAAEAPGVVLGTPGYMAPEQQRGDVGRIDARTDVYALGAVLRFLLGTGVPRPLLAVCAKAMSAFPESRYQGAGEIGAEIARYLDGRRVEAFPEGLWLKAARLYARHRVAFWLIVAYLVVRGALLFFTGR
jgi:eukaryotic-like serine/threonine-protein kinase